MKTKPANRAPSTTPATRKSVTAKKVTKQAPSAPARKTSPTAPVGKKPPLTTATAKKAAVTRKPAPKTAKPATKWTVAAPVSHASVTRDALVMPTSDLGDSIAYNPGPQHSIARIGADAHDASIHDAPTFKPTVERFINEYIVSLNATDAYQIAHPTAKRSSAQVEGSKTLSNPMVAAEIARRRKLALDANGLTLEKVVGGLWDAWTADVDALTSWRVGNCRYCHGTAFRYQRTDSEYAEEKELFDLAGGYPRRKKRRGESQKAFDEEQTNRTEWKERGGPGFDRRRDPNPDCPHCAGEGIGRMVMADTRKLGPKERALFAGVKETKDGLEIKMHDKVAVVEKLMRHIGGYEKDNDQKNLGNLTALTAAFNKTNALPIAHDVAKDELS